MLKTYLLIIIKSPLLTSLASFLITPLSILMQPKEAYLPRDFGLLLPCINSPVGLLFPVWGSTFSRQIILGP